MEHGRPPHDSCVGGGLYERLPYGKPTVACGDGGRYSVPTAVPTTTKRRLIRPNVDNMIECVAFAIEVNL